MSFFWGILAGIAWGAAAAVLNGVIGKICVKKNTSGAMMAANVLKLAVDVLALLAVFLLRNVLPFSFEAAILGTVVSLSMLGIVISYHIANS